MSGKNRKTMVSLLVAAVLCLNSIFALWTANSTEALASDATKVEDVTYEMKYGASVRYAETAEESGLRFAATMPKTEYEALQNSGYAELTFGMLIMPYNYLEQYGEFTVENVFGTDAVYDWATLDDEGNWVYSGNKVRIINITSNQMTSDRDDESLCVMNGSITGVLENNLARDFVGMGYIRYKETTSDAYSYRFADYAEGNLHNNVRSIVEVAEAVHESNGATDEQKQLVKKYYIDATDVRCVKFYDNNELLEIHKSFTEYFFDGVPLAEAEDGHEFAYWVDQNGDKVTIEKDTTEVTKTMKLYAVYTTNGLDYVADGYLGQNGKIMTAIQEFVAMNVTKANIADAQLQYESVKEYLDILRASEYNALVDADTRTAINNQVANINKVLEESDDLYETYSAIVSEETSTSCAQDVATTMSFPCFNYSLLQKVSFDWTTTGWSLAGYGEDLWYYNAATALGGTATISNNGDGTLIVMMTETANSLGTNSVIITDADIVNGNKPVTFAAKSLVNTQIFNIGAITATSLYDFTAVDGEQVLYTGQNLIDNTSVADANGTAPFSESASDLIEGGVNYDCSGTGDTNWTISLPKINYGAYETVSMSFQATNNWQTIGFVDGSTISDGGSDALAGTITITNNGDGTLTGEITTTSPKAETVTHTFTDSEIINGTKSLSLFWNNGAVYRQMSIGPISATMSMNSKLAVAAEKGKTPKLVASTLFADDNLIDNTSVADANGTAPFSESASSLIEGGVNYDCSGTGDTNWTISLPKINYGAYETVSMSFQATNNWQTIGFVDGSTISDGGGDALAGTITITNNGDGTLTGEITTTSPKAETATHTFTDSEIINGAKSLPLFWNNGAVYRQMSIGPITATSRVSAESVAGIDVADKGVALERPYYVITGQTLYAGQKLIDNVSIDNASVTINHYNELYPNAVQFDPSGNTVTATISLPRINYASYEKVTMQFWGRNAWQQFGFSVNNSISDSQDDSKPFNGTITIVTNEDGTLTGTITDETTGHSTSELIEETEIINGTSPLTFYWSTGVGYRQLLIGPISCDTTARVTTSPATTPYTIVDFSKSTYEVNAVDMTDESRDILVRRHLDDNTKLYVETQNPSVTDTRMYALELPWIAYNKYRSVSTTISSNNGYAGLTTDGAFYSTIDGIELKMTYVDGTLTVTLGDSGVICTDTDVLNGRKGLTIYIQGSQYTMSYLSAFEAVGKTAPISSGTRSQALDLAKLSGSTNVSEYRIAYDADGAYNDVNYYKWIAEEMKLFLEEMTGTTFLTVGIHDASVISNTSKYIVIGERLAKANGVENFDLTQTNGYNVKQDYKNLYIYGGSPRGTMNGVYGFLQDITGLTFYTDEVYTHEYKNLDIESGYATVFNPSFNIGITGYAEAQYSKEYHSRLGLSNDGYIGTGAKEDANADGIQETIGTHCMLEVLPYDTYGAEYPEWYAEDSEGNWQLDFTNDNRDKMLEIVVASAKDAILAFPNHDYFVFGQPDGMYGPDVAEYLTFVNDCSEEIDSWLKAEGATRMVSLCMFAYNGTLPAPTSGSFYNGDCAKTAVIFAPVGARYTHTFATSEHKNTLSSEWSGKTIEEYLNDWKNLEGANIHFWLYGTDYSNYMMPMNTITNMQANYQAAHKVGTDAIHYQFQTGPQPSVGSDWQRLKTYLSAELTKNVDADVTALQSNFMEAMYGAGAENMELLLKAQQETVAYNNFNEKDPLFYPYNTEQYFGVINGSNRLLTSTYFKEDMLLEWMGYIETAKAAIEADSTLTDARKQMLLNNVDVEALSIRYMLIELHDNTTYDATLSAWKTAAKALGCNALSETEIIN